MTMSLPFRAHDEQVDAPSHTGDLLNQRAPTTMSLSSTCGSSLISCDWQAGEAARCLTATVQAPPASGLLQPIGGWRPGIECSDEGLGSPFVRERCASEPGHGLTSLVAGEDRVLKLPRTGGFLVSNTRMRRPDDEALSLDGS